MMCFYVTANTRTPAAFLWTTTANTCTPVAFRWTTTANTCTPVRYAWLRIKSVGFHVSLEKDDATNIYNLSARGERWGWTSINVIL